MGVLLAAGCSFTGYETYSKNIHVVEPIDFELWPNIVANELGMECLNIGRCGASNDYISSTVMETILNRDDIDAVYILLTDWLRTNTFEIAGWDLHIAGQPNTLISDDNIPNHQDSIIARHKNVKQRMAVLEIFKDLHETCPAENLIDSIIKHAVYKNIVPLQHICKLRNIPLKIMQGLTPINPYSWLFRLLGYIFEKSGALPQNIIPDNIVKYEQHIDVGNFKGWPIYSSIGGFHWDFAKTRPDLIMSQSNAHPNKKGHELLARRFLD
jgi:hypothetical protein